MERASQSQQNSSCHGQEPGGLATSGLPSSPDPGHGQNTPGWYSEEGTAAGVTPAQEALPCIHYKPRVPALRDSNGGLYEGS